MEAADLLQKRRIDGRTSWMFTTQSIKSDKDDTTGSIKSDDKSDDDAAAPPFAERRTAHRGVGLYATRRIRAGERFIEEVPLATWCVAVDATTAEKARSFEQMQAGLPASTVAAILKLGRNPDYKLRTTRTIRARFGYGFGSSARPEAMAGRGGGDEDDLVSFLTAVAMANRRRVVVVP